MPTWAVSALRDNDYIDGFRWSSAKAAAAIVGQGRKDDVAPLADALERACQPCPPEKLVQRLTALGMTMAPNRPPAEASVWVHEMARLLRDLAEDIVMEAIDEVQRQSKFLPTVAEIRAIADPLMEERREQRSKFEAMRRFIESGQTLPRYEPTKRPVMDRRGEPMSEEETAELNAALERLGACSRYRPDGSRYMVKERPAPQSSAKSIMPTREDYISWGVDPAVLDNIAAENAA